MTAVIECQSLTKRYRQVTALAGLDLSVEAGTVFGFLGPNGAGKTTTLRILLGLAVALMRQPSLLLLDEPANGLDPAGIAEFRGLLRSLADGGTTVFLSSHLLAEVEQVCDQIAVIQSGRLVSQGPARAAPRVRVVVAPAEQAAAVAALARWAARADGADGVLTDTADGRAVNQALGQAGIWAWQILLERPALEAAFLSLTGETHAAARR